MSTQTNPAEQGVRRVLCLAAGGVEVRIARGPAYVADLAAPRSLQRLVVDTASVADYEALGDEARWITWPAKDIHHRPED